MIVCRKPPTTQNAIQKIRNSYSRNVKKKILSFFSVYFGHRKIYMQKRLLKNVFSLKNRRAMKVVVKNRKIK